MLRLNSKPIVTKVISAKNLNVKKFRLNLNDQLKNQFDNLLNELQE